MYVTELKKLAEFCNFRETLKPMLQDHIICRIDNKCWQHRVLGEDDLTYEDSSSTTISVQLVLQGPTKSASLINLRDPGTYERLSPTKMFDELFFC